MSLIQDALKRQQGDDDDDNNDSGAPTPPHSAEPQAPAPRPVLKRKTAPAQPEEKSVEPKTEEPTSDAPPPSQLIQQALEKSTADAGDASPPPPPPQAPPPTPQAPPPPPPQTPPPADSDPTPSTDESPDTSGETDDATTKVASSGSKPVLMIVGVAVLALALVGGSVYFVMGLLKGDNPEETGTTVTQTPPETNEPTQAAPSAGQNEATQNTETNASEQTQVVVTPPTPTPPVRTDGPVDLVLRKRIDHGSDVDSVSISPSGNVIASVLNDNAVNLWNPATGKQVATLEGTNVFAHSVAFDNSSRYILMNNQKLRVWDYTTQAPVQQYNWKNAAGRFDSISVSRDGSKAAFAASQTKRVLIWSLEEASTIQEISLPKGAGATDLAFSPDGARLAVAGQKYVHVFDAATAALSYTITASLPDKVAFSPDGSTLIHLIQSENIAVVNAADGKPIRTIENPGKNTLTRLIFSGDGKYLFGASWDGHVYVWEFASGKLHKKFKAHDEWVTCMSMSADARTLVTGSYDNSIAVWDLAGVMPHRLQSSEIALDKSLAQVAETAVQEVSVTPVVEAPKPAAKWPKVEVSGFMGSGKKGAAILNGEVVQVGGEIEGVLVKSIDGRSVVLEYQGEQRVLKAGSKTK